MEQPLSGINVLEIASLVAVPQATQLLASYGADVIKVEDTSVGDTLRYNGTRKGGISGWFATVNSGKRSIALNLKSEKGKQILLDLVKNADVVIEGFRSEDVMIRLGLGYSELRSVNPRIIYCSSSGFGSEGPYAKRPSYDTLIQALSGWSVKNESSDQPSPVRAFVADKIAAYNNAQAIMAALVQRSRTDKGCQIRTNMLDANIAFVWPDVMMHCTLLDETGVEDKPNILDGYRFFSTKDGGVSVVIGNDYQWAAFCEAFDQKDNVDKYATLEQRTINFKSMYELIESVTSNYTTEQVIDRLVDYDVPCAPALSPDDVSKDLHIVDTKTVEDSVHPIAGRYRHPRSRSAQFGSAAPLRPAPAWGEHSLEILIELGYEQSEIDTFRRQKIVKIRESTNQSDRESNTE